MSKVLSAIILESWIIAYVEQHFPIKVGLFIPYVIQQGLNPLKGILL